MSGRRGFFVGVIAVLSLSALVQAAPLSASVRERAPLGLPLVRSYEEFELTIPLRTRYSNPFDPDVVRVQAAFTTPGGQVLSVPGFYYQGYTRTRTAHGDEMLTPAGAGAFKVRFAWGVAGVYHYEVRLTDARGTRVVADGRFAVRAGDGNGYLRRSTSAPHYFQFDSGASYFALGENVCWPGRSGTYDYDRWFNELADNGGNYARIWLVNNWNPLGLEKSDAVAGDGLGRYDQQSAWRLDYITNLARRRGIRLMLCLDSFNSLATGQDGEWRNSPYNTKNGGPCATPADFFTNAEAKRIFKHRLRYLVARWGYSTHVMAWEFFNEVDISSGYNSARVAAWHREMADYLRSIDPWRHLITTSFANSPGDPAVDSLPELDYVQTHSYGTHDAAGTVQAFTRSKLDAYGKPTYLGEFGIDWQPGSYPEDPDGLHLHNALWAGVHAGSAGTPMTWWWDNYVEPKHLYYHFAKLAAYVAGIDWVRENYHPVPVTGLAYAPGEPPAYTPLSIDPPGESWSGSAFNRPHTFTVGSDGSISHLAVMSRLLHGRVNHPTWHNPATFRVNYPRAGRFEVNVDGVSGFGGAALEITLDGRQALAADFPDRLPDDHKTMHQYDRAYGLDVPAGPHTIVVENTGRDWCYVSYRLTHYVTAPNLRVLGLSNATSALVWAQNKDHTWWNRAQGQTPTPLPVCVITLGGFTPGRYRIQRWDTWAGAAVGVSTVASTGGTLTLHTPKGLISDLAWKIRKVR